MKSIAMGVTIAGILVGASAAFVLAQTGRARDADRPEPVAKVAPSATPPKLDLYGDPLPAGATMRFGTIRHRQEAPIYRIAFTRDDKFIVTDGDDSQLRVWDGHDGKLVRRIPVPIDALSDFAITSDGKTVATTGINFVKGSGFVRQVVSNELATGRQASQQSWVENLSLPKTALDPDRQLLVTAARGQLAITRIETGKETAHAILENEDVKYLEFSADRNRLAVASRVKDEREPHGQRLRVFDVENTGDFRCLAKFDVDCDNLAFSPAGNLFVGTQHPATLTFFDVPSGTPHRIERIYANQISFSSDGKTIACIRTPGDMLVFWNPVARRYIDLLKTSSHLAGQLAFSFDRRTIAANGGQNVLHLWDIASGRERVETTDAHEDRINAVLAARGPEVLITASADRTIRMWSMSTGRQLRALRHEDRVATMSLSEDGRSLIAGMDFQPLIYVWSIEADDPPAILKAPNGKETLAITYADTDRSILAMDGDGIIRRWNAGDRRLVNEVSLKSLLKPMELDPRITEEFTAATFFAGGRKLAVTSISTGLHIVDVQSGKEIGRVPDAKLVAGSPDSKTLAIARNGSGSKYKRMGNETIIQTVSPSATIVLVDGDNCREIRQIEVPNSEVWSLAFGSDSKTLAATSGWETGQIHLYEVATGKEFRTIETPAIRTPALTFTPDGSKLVCGMADTSVLVWNVEGTP